MHGVAMRLFGHVGIVHDKLRKVAQICCPFKPRGGQIDFFIAKPTGPTEAREGTGDDFGGDPRDRWPLRRMESR